MIDILLERNVRTMLRSVDGKYSTYLMQQIVFGLVFGFIAGAIYHFNTADEGFTFSTILVGIGGYILASKYVYIQLMNEIKQRKKVRREMFPDFLKYFNSTLAPSNDNIRNALEMAQVYLDDPLYDEVGLMIKRIDNNEADLAFRKFADYIGTGEAVMTMGMLGDFYKQGIDKSKLKDMEVLVSKMAEQTLLEKATRNAVKIESTANPSLLLTVGFVMGFVGLFMMMMLGQLGL